MINNIEMNKIITKKLNDEDKCEQWVKDKQYVNEENCF